jgi:hydroxyacylglutathione hydrolase
VFCAHEYTVGNLRFARAAEPEGLRVAERLDEALMLRAAGRATLPSSIAIERGSNPFFRADDPALDAGIQARLGRPPQNRVERFATLRDWKNQFR